MLKYKEQVMKTLKIKVKNMSKNTKLVYDLYKNGLNNVLNNNINNIIYSINLYPIKYTILTIKLIIFYNFLLLSKLFYKKTNSSNKNFSFLQNKIYYPRYRQVLFIQSY